MYLFLLLFLNYLSNSLPPISQGNFINSGTPSGVTIDFDCKVREYAWEYGKTLQPRHNNFVDLFDALQLSACNITRPTPSQYTPPHFPSSTSNDNQCTYYVDPTKGSDTNSGSINSPLLTIQTAINVVRNNRQSNTEQCYINLRQGIFYLDKTIQLTNKDNYLIIQNYNSEKVIISGGILLNVSGKWENVSFKEFKWYTYEGLNNCYNRVNVGESNDLIDYIGMYNDVDSCQQAVVGNKVLYRSFCWYDTSVAKYAGGCYGVKDYSWQTYPQHNVYSGKYDGLNIWKVKITNNNITKINGLRINNQRGIPARYPNTIPEQSMQYDPISSWISYTTTWLPPKTYPPPINIIYTANNYSSDIIWPMVTPGYNNTNQYTGIGNWGEFHIGYGGTCNNEGITPKYGYWCSNNPPRGTIYTHTSPSGIILPKQNILPNTPYNNIVNARIHTWRQNHWFTLMFEINNTNLFNPNTNELNFSRGGFQGGESANIGAEWYIENIFEELDFPSEFYFNQTTMELFYFNNDTKQEPPSNDMEFVATNLKILFNISAGLNNQEIPVKNITLQGLIFRDTQFTYLDDHGMPSGGDWGLQYQGAINIESCEYCLINSSLFTRLDGNGIFVNGYNRYISIINNDFEYIGDTNIAVLGYSSTPDNNKYLINTGPDGRNGNQPRFMYIGNNKANEIGLFQKQSAFYFQAVSCSNIIENNVVFNGARALINYNDAFGGNNTLQYNLLINAVRESGDHGPFNSWNRMPYITKVADGVTSSILPAYNKINNNFIIGTYLTQDDIDNDDGSAYYETYNNFLVYGTTGLKCDFNGNYNKHYGNVYAYVSNAYENTCAYDEFHDNNIIFVGDGTYVSTCNSAPGFISYSNNLYNQKGNINCCGTDLNTWVSKGNDNGTNINTLPTDDQVIQMGKQALSR